MSFKSSDKYRMVSMQRSHANELDAFRDRLEAAFGRRVAMSEAIVIAVRKCSTDVNTVASENTAREMTRV